MGFHGVLEWGGCVLPEGEQRKVLWKGRRNKGIGLGTENLTRAWGPVGTGSGALRKESVFPVSLCFVNAV